MSSCWPWGSRRKNKEVIVLQQPDPVLFDLLHWSPWKEIERKQYDNTKLHQYIQIHPEGVSVKYEFKSAGRGSVKRYPLVRAVCLGASIEVIMDMYNIFPDAIHELGEFSTTPLHAACAYQCSLEVIEFLLNKYPEASNIRNKHGYYPIHLVCEYGVSTTKVIEILIKANPQALQQKNKLGQTPYQIIQSKQRGDTTTTTTDTTANQQQQQETFFRILQEYQSNDQSTPTEEEIISSSVGGSTTRDEVDVSSTFFAGTC